MAATPCHQLGDIIIGDVGDQFVFTKKLYQIADLPFGIARTGMMLTDFLPIASGDVVELQRGCRRLGLLDVLLGALSRSMRSTASASRRFVRLVEPKKR